MFGIEWINLEWLHLEWLNLKWIALYVPLYLTLGALVGFIAGLLGASGGGILVPLLVSIFTYQAIDTDRVVHLALGTALTCMIASSISSTRAHAAKNNIEWKVVAGMTPGIIIGAFLITQVAANLNSTFISLFFSLFMMLVAAKMFFNWQPKTSSEPVSLNGLTIAGFTIGPISALAAVGGGFLTIAYLSYKGIAIKRAIGTSAAIALPLSIAGTIGYAISGWSETLENEYTFGFIYWPAFLAISLTSMLVAPYGARCSQYFSDKLLKRILALISLLLSLKMFISFVQF